VRLTYPLPLLVIVIGDGLGDHRCHWFKTDGGKLHHYQIGIHHYQIGIQSVQI
jgi:hypothetical protein